MRSSGPADRTLHPLAPSARPDHLKDSLLRTLRAAVQPVSGEALAAALGISRAAVWKRIQGLKALGYVIQGEPRRGYVLLAAPDKLLPAEVLDNLNTRLFRGPVHHFETIASTNDLAKELGAKGAAEGTLVVAEHQVAGRGRLEREWHSPAGVGLYVSLLLRPPLPPHELPQITLTAAVAAVRAVKRAAGVAPGIKWPNDLILTGKKVGGILTEMESEADRIRHLVLGLGLNVNNPGFAGELTDIATSLSLALGLTCSRLALLKAWLEEMEELYERFLDRDFPSILAEWREHSVTLGKQVRVRQGMTEVTGLALEVDLDGALRLKTDAGETLRVTSGELAPDP